MTARLAIVLGPGGVGKTTLASALGLAHARAGEHAALLGVDPAHRLRSALALPELSEHGVRVPIDAPGSLDAALLDPSACLRRWVADACPDPEQRARIAANPFFVALADRLASFTDAIGCARAVEWVERDPALTELVLDTAPGTPALELLARPDKLAAFFDGRLIRWLARFAGGIYTGRTVSRLADLSGTGALREFGALVSTLEGAIAKLVERLELARRWLRDPETSIVLASGVGEDAAAATRELARGARALGFSPRLIVLNRVLPDVLASSPDRATRSPQAAAFARYVRGYLRAQQRARAELAAELTPVIEIADTAMLDAPDRLAALTELGEPLRARLAAQRRVDRPRRLRSRV
ncbi:MAG TPA: ArsA-related P-loop ATPase [Kofleriaceae bacterium]|nr:ArsA-related P-loop ATPase [Kofleriaceae bacterium]